MKAFLAHAHEDKGSVERVASWLREKAIDIWVDSWRLKPGDSLVARIPAAIEAADRLAVFLSPDSVASAWVTREVEMGIVLELAQEKGADENFVIPVLLRPTKVPLILRPKLYADFTNKAFEAACDELLLGISGKEPGPRLTSHVNGFATVRPITPLYGGKHGTLMELGVKITPTSGAHVVVDAGGGFTKKVEHFGSPGMSEWPPMVGGAMFQMSIERSSGSVHNHQFQSPDITARRSYYVYFESENPIQPRVLRFTDFNGAEP